MENIKIIAEGKLVNRFAIGKKQVFYKTTTYLRSLALKVGEPNQFPFAPNPDRHRWNEMILWVQEKTPTSRSEAATC